MKENEKQQREDTKGDFCLQETKDPTQRRRVSWIIYG
jgi:hypothetical protein